MKLRHHLIPPELAAINCPTMMLFLLQIREQVMHKKIENNKWKSKPGGLFGNYRVTSWRSQVGENLRRRVQETFGIVHAIQKRIVTVCLLCVLKLELTKAVGLVSFSTPKERL
jgi:hypothetical protein